MALYRTKNVFISIGHSRSPLSRVRFRCICLALILILSFQPEKVDSQGGQPAAAAATGGGEGASYQQCRRSGTECTCSSQTIIDYFQEAFVKSASRYSRAPHIMQDMIERFSCNSYTPIPAYLTVHMPDNMESFWYFDKRRRKMYRARRSIEEGYVQALTGGRTRRKRQLSLGYPNPEKFAEVIAHIPKLSSHHYAALGSEISMHCFGGDSERGIQEDLYGYSRRFDWIHINGMPITAPLVVFDPYSGDLTFKAVRLADTGIYNCSVTLNEDSEGMEVKAFQSQLDVISAPMIWLRFGISYHVDRCRHKELLLIQDHIPDWVQQYVCHFCPVRNVSVTCINVEETSQEGKVVQISFALSTLGFEKLIMVYEHYSYMCQMECLEQMHFKIITVFLASLMKLFELQINVEPSDGKTTVYVPDTGTRDDDIAFGCPAGFFENYKLCFPCAAGKYSPHGKDQCFPCPEGLFQPNPGSSACFPCPRGYSTLGEGARSQTECVLDALSNSVKFAKFHWILSLVGLAILAFILFVILTCCCCPDSCFMTCLTCGCCCGKKKKRDMDDIEILERERIITTTSDEYTEDEMSSGKRKWWNKPKAPRFPRSEDEEEYRYRNYDDRAMRDIRRDAQTSTSKANIPVPPKLPSSASLSRKSKAGQTEPPKPSKSLFKSISEKFTFSKKDVRPLPEDIQNMNLPSPASLSRRTRAVAEPPNPQKEVRAPPQDNKKTKPPSVSSKRTLVGSMKETHQILPERPSQMKLNRKSRSEGILPPSGPSKSKSLTKRLPFSLQSKQPNAVSPVPKKSKSSQIDPANPQNIKLHHVIPERPSAQPFPQKHISRRIVTAPKNFVTAPVPKQQSQPTSSDDSRNVPPEVRAHARKCFKVKRPHLKLGNALNKSESLQNKLREQRQKLGEYSNNNTENSSLSTHGMEEQKSRVKNVVQIAENRNTYHAHSWNKDPVVLPSLKAKSSKMQNTMNSDSSNATSSAAVKRQSRSTISRHHRRK